jgi:hypothetical protein
MLQVAAYHSSISAGADTVSNPAPASAILAITYSGASPSTERPPRKQYNGLSGQAVACQGPLLAHRCSKEDDRLTMLKARPMPKQNSELAPALGANVAQGPGAIVLSTYTLHLDLRRAVYLEVSSCFGWP